MKSKAQSYYFRVLRALLHASSNSSFVISLESNSGFIIIFERGGIGSIPGLVDLLESSALA